MALIYLMNFPEEYDRPDREQARIHYVQDFKADCGVYAWKKACQEVDHLRQKGITDWRAVAERKRDKKRKEKKSIRRRQKQT